MKTIAVLVAALVIKSLDAAILKAVVASAPASVVASAPASGSPAPQPPSLDALHINFEIKNFNYYDLTRETCPQKVKVHKTKKGGKPPAPSAKGGKTKRHPLFKKDPLADLDKLPVIKADEVKGPNITAAMDDMHGHSDAIAKQMEAPIQRDRQANALPWMEDKDDKDDESFLQTNVGACGAMPDLAETKSTECTTVMDVLRTAIEETIKGIISCLQHSAPMGPAAAPGPAPPMPVVLPVSTLPAAPAGAVGLVPLPPQALPQVFLQMRASGPASAFAPGPAPGPAAPVSDVKVFVTFAPGREMEGGRSTMVEVTFMDRPANGLDDVAFAKPFIEQSIGSGLFHKQIRKALHQVTGIKPKLRGIVMATKAIEQWDVNTCEEHIKGIVGQFSLHYTRNQVPMALYNECTNFMTRMSFSHDYVLDPMDTVRCRRATATFANHWEHGDHAKDTDFADMCHNACEAKFGRNAPKCNIASGDGLMHQPL